MAKLAKPLMTRGGSLTSLNFLSAERLWTNKTSSDWSRQPLNHRRVFLRTQLGQKAIRDNAFSADAIRTRASSGIEHLDELIDEIDVKASLRRTVIPDEIGRASLLLASDYTTGTTGEVLHVNAGFNVTGMVFH